MAIRLRVELQVAVSSDSSEAKDLGHVRASSVSDVLGEGGARKITLAANSTDVEIELANITTARFLLLAVQPADENDPAQEITVKLNTTGGDPITVKPFDDGKCAYLLMTTDSVTALYATNPSTDVDVELTIVTGGD